MTNWVFIPESLVAKAWSLSEYAFVTLTANHGDEAGFSFSVHSARLEFASLFPDDQLAPINDD